MPSPLRRTLLGDGAIVAVKGLGGYHLACRAGDEEAVAAPALAKAARAEAARGPGRDLAAARELVELTAAEEALLTGPERPIVIARRVADAAIAPSSRRARPTSA